MKAFLASAWQNLPAWGVLQMVDVLLVSYVFYRLMLFVRGTRSVQILQGILFLAVATFLVGNVFRLPTMEWLLQKFWMAGIVVLAVVFQPEIRSALAQLGGQQFSRWILPGEFEFVQEIVQALKECSDKRIGALLALEQETGLKNFIETGTRINAEISSELILSILHPRSPLHDGAIVISGAQIAAAGCLLPLSDDPHFAKILGTRHRAAVGLSEASDAVVLVVSEETGVISIARQGRLQRDADTDALKARLLELYRSKSDRSVLRKGEERDPS